MFEKINKILELYVIFARKKSYQNARIFIIFTRKINKISEFHTISPKMSKFYVIIAQKINYIFENFIGRGTWGAHRILRL